MARVMLVHARMEPHPQNSQKTLAKAHRQATATHLKKGAQRLEKGITRFADHNGKIVSGVALGAGALFALGRLARPGRRRPRLLPRMNVSLRRRRRGIDPKMAGTLIGALALVGAGVTMIVAPRWLMSTKAAQKIFAPSN
jgi:hypothetical protein